MISEKEINRSIWWVINEIKKEALVIPSDAYVDFWYQSERQNIPSKNDQKRAITKLLNNGAIKMVKWLYPKPIDSFVGFTNQLGIEPAGVRMELLQPVFNNMIAHFEAIQNQEEVLRWGKLEMNASTCTIKYARKLFRPSWNNVIRLLQLLLKNKGVVEYITIAKHLNLNAKTEAATKNEDVSKAVQDVKNRLAQYLLNVVGMGKNEVNSMILTVSKSGYRIAHEISDKFR